MTKKYYIFTISIGGFGESVDEAWNDAVDNTNINELEQPNDYIIDEEVIT